MSAGTPEEEDELSGTSAPLVEHLAELRTRLIRSLLAFIAAMILCFTVWNPIFDFLTRPLCDALAQNDQQDCGLVLIKLQEGFFVAVSISLVGALALSFPYLSFQMWRFVAPGLYRREKGAFLPFMLASPLMFFIGAAFAYYIVTPLAFDFFLGFQQQGSLPAEGGGAESSAISFMGSAQEYLSLTIKFIVAFGLCFQLPVLLTLMGKAGLVSSDGLARTRKYAVVGILALAAVATPPDVISQVILFVVVFGLYEISIHLVRRVETRREADLRAQGLWFEDDDDQTGGDSDGRGE